MNRLFPASFLIIVIIYGCASNGTSNTKADSSDTQAAATAVIPAQTATDTTGIKGRWNLIPAMASDTAAGKLPYLVFDNGRVSGNTGCNSFSGSYKQSGINLSFDSNMVTTRMACMGYDENAFVKNLLRTTGFDKKGDTLVLKEDMTPLSYWLNGK